MSDSQTLGGASTSGRVLGASLDKILNNVPWRKHSHLVAACKSALDKLETLTDATSSPDPQSPLFGFTLADAESFLQPIFLALDSGSVKVAEPAIQCASTLFSFGLIRGEASGESPSLVFQLLDAACKCCGLGDDSTELAVMRGLLSAVRSPSVLIRGDFLLHIVRTCYNVYLGSLSGTNQMCAKSVLAQIMVIVFTRVEEDSMEVSIPAISVNGLLEFADKNLCEGSSIQFVQNFINQVMECSERTLDVKYPPYSLQSAKISPSEVNDQGEVEDGELNDGPDSSGGSKIREDGFMLFKNLCKLSMKFSAQEHSDDDILLRGKILALELLKVVIDNAGPIWRLNERFLNAVRQYLCLSLLKNSALSVMTIFQLLCSIFMNLLLKFRSGLKAEIGIFFPMLILCVLENVLRPSYLQKTTVLNLLEKISLDSQIVIDIFVNYDCDVTAPNIFERIVNGLLKTTLGPPPGSTTTLSSAQDITFRIESVKCLVSIIKSMGVWMDQQLRIGDIYPDKISESFVSPETHTTLNGEKGAVSDHDLHPELNSELSDAASLEQRRAYKIELQKGISMFNRKPSKGIDFLISNKNIGGSPEEVATFLQTVTGLNKTMIGDYLGERKEFPLKVMHAYVDSFNFEAMDFGESLRYFLRGFRLPGEAQKIDRIMEKFAERYCKCNPASFSRADTAYVLAYSVIMLNTDAHNIMVKDKMTKADFVRNNRGIDDGKDLPEEYLGALYDQIVCNEIKMNADSSVPQRKQAHGFNKLLGMDGILSLMTWKQTVENPLGANGALINHIQDQFKAKSGKPESIYYNVMDVTILRFMVEVCWGPMLAAFSVTLDQSDNKTATSQCLQGFRHAVHVTAAIGMQTQRDAFVTTVAKFTYLHCAADMKQKNADAVKAIMSIAIEDGNYLHEAWEHILTCVSRFEHLQLLGDGLPLDASTNGEIEEKSHKSTNFPSLKIKGTLQNPAMMAVVRGGSYDSTASGFNNSGPVTQEQINNFISNLNLLDQIGSFELNHIFAHSQRLNNEAIADFVKALCRVSITELHSPTEPRVFSLTKIFEIVHYNMSRIRLVWSRMWNVLSDFFISVGLSENLSVSILVMDSLCQLAMKFLEHEELTNYNFQDEFLRPFVIVMQKSYSAEIRELIVRCISEMILTHVNNVKSGWRSVFMIFTVAAADERKNIVLLAFETMEKIVREYFPYITETETLTFTDCVGCLLTFTKSRFTSDVSLNAIAFLRFCALKLAEGGLVCNKERKNDESSAPIANQGGLDGKTFSEQDDHLSFWVPLLTGLSKLTSDHRSAMRKISLEVLFNILKDHGHLFSRSSWIHIFSSVIFPIFKCEGNTWDHETYAVALQCLVDIFVSFFNMVTPQLPSVLSILTGSIQSTLQGRANNGVAALLRLTGNLGSKLSNDEWGEIFWALKEAAASTLPSFLEVMKTMDNIEVADTAESQTAKESGVRGFSHDLDDDDYLQTAAFVISKMKTHIAVQLQIIQVAADLYRTHLKFLSADNITIILDIFSFTASQACRLNSETTLQTKMQKACSILGLSDPPLIHFLNESYKKYLNFLKTLLNSPSVPDEMNIESQLVALCEKMLHIYLDCAESTFVQRSLVNRHVLHWILPLGLQKRGDLAARTSLVLSALQVLSGLERECFKRYVSSFFPLLVNLVRSEHSSVEVQHAGSKIFELCIGPIIIKSSRDS